MLDYLAIIMQTRKVNCICEKGCQNERLQNSFTKKLSIANQNLIPCSTKSNARLIPKGRYVLLSNILHGNSDEHQAIPKELVS